MMGDTSLLEGGVNEGPHVLLREVEDEVVAHDGAEHAHELTLVNEAVLVVVVDPEGQLQLLIQSALGAEDRQATHELPEVDDLVLVLVKDREEAFGEGRVLEAQGLLELSQVNHPVRVDRRADLLEVLVQLSYLLFRN